MLDLAVIPIFVNAGAAILPAVLAGVSSFLALLLRPRELARACRRRPGVALGAVIALPVLWFGGSWAVATASAWMTPPPQPAQVDWALKGLEILQQERALATGAAVGGGEGPAGDIVFGRDFSRRGHDGCPPPRSICPFWAHKSEGVMFLSSPALRGKRVYAGTALVDLTGKFGSVVCLDAAGGKVLWETTDAGDLPLKPIISSPAVTADGARIIIGQGLHDDKDCALLCLDAATGKVLWQSPTPLHIESSPAVRGDMAVVGAGAIEGPDRKPTGHAGLVLAVRISDGKTLWTHELADPESSPAIGEDGTVYIGSGFNGSAVVALRSGGDAELKAAGLSRQIWRTSLPYPVTGAISLCGERLLVGGGNGDYAFSSDKPAGMVAALDRRDGRILWQAPMGDAVLGPLACSEKIALCPVRTGELVALSPADGKPIWSQRISGKAAVLSGCVLAGDKAIALSSDGYLALLDARDGRLLQKHYVNDPARPGQQGLSISTPTLAGNLVLVGSETGGLRAFLCQGTEPAKVSVSHE